MSTAIFVSFRLGMSDGVSIVAQTWQRALHQLGFDTVTVAGEGPVDRVVEGLAIGAAHGPDPTALSAALADGDVVVVENLCTIPLNLPAARQVARTLAGRPALLHHHDPAWQRPHLAHITELPPDDPAWRHVTINQMTQREMAERGITATTIYNGFDPDPQPGDRAATRRALGVAPDEVLVLHPVRAIPRKEVGAALDLAAALGATYWLTGPAEDGYDAELARLLAAARCPVLHRPAPTTMADAYAAADVVAFPSSWEGFGNPPIEAALHGKPAVVGRYPVAQELRALGFRWFEPHQAEAVAAFLAAPDEAWLAHNRQVARTHLSHDRVVADLDALFTEADWTARH